MTASPTPQQLLLPSAGDPVATAAAIQAQAEENFAARHVAAVFEKFERDHYECQELLTQMNVQWLLSSEEQRMGGGAAPGATGSAAVDLPQGLISKLGQVNDSRIVLLVPVEDESGRTSFLDMREVG